jgi:undecaprenyl-diphosphatase
MIFITTLGNGGIFWILLTLVLLLNKRTRHLGITCALSLILMLFINNIFIKNIVARTRPYEVIEGLTILVSKPVDFSFPSGHTASSFAVAVVLMKECKTKWKYAALLLAILIAFSRLYVGVHYPTDVIGGLILGIIYAFIAMFIINRIKFPDKLFGIELGLNKSDE